MAESDFDCKTLVGLSTLGGYLSGAVYGGIVSNWSDVPKVLRDQSWPALKRTGGMMNRYGLALGVLGLTYTSTKCVLESVRGKEDWRNILAAGSTGGVVLGATTGKLSSSLSMGATLGAVALAGWLSGIGRKDISGLPNVTIPVAKLKQQTKIE
jgi:hypothetical protein